ncbi:MAG: glycogen synthase GlgA [bacterium]|nr:glycogen synthase GlgA [bacterium]
MKIALNIAMISSEAAPYSKTGGMADVCGALPKALIKAGHNVMVFSPFYKEVMHSGRDIKETAMQIKVKLGKKEYSAKIWKEGNFYFIQNNDFYLREELYGSGLNDYPDNHLRFAFLSIASLEAIEQMREKIDILHCHDWQTALAPLYLKMHYKNKDLFSGTASVFTIHNLAYQGLFPEEAMEDIGLPKSLFNYKELEFHNQLSFIKSGLIFSDLLSTVSRKYSKEIQGADFGCGLEGVLKERSKQLFGIINGIDYKEWDPASDIHIKKNYSVSNLAGKTACKKELKKIFKLPYIGDVPLIGMVSRLDAQKGFELIEKAEKNLLGLPLQLVFLGKGSKSIQAFLKKMAKKHPEKVGLKIGYDNALAHKIEAGADIFLMPSHYEPCGLNHLYSLKYGTIPIVRATGGLDDTIVAYSPAGKKGNGFKFRAYTADAMLKSIKKALHIFSSEPKEWERLQITAMREEHSWEKSAANYIEIYGKALLAANINKESGKNKQ